MRTTALLFSALVLAAAPSVARANTPEDLSGLGARARAMGGAGTATARDFSTIYYNPAGLALCPTRSFTLDLSHAVNGLDLEAEPDDPELEEVRDQTRVYVGACTALPYGLAFGFSFGTGLQNPTTLDQTTLDPEPQYLLYGEAQEQLSIMLGLGFRMFDELAIGIGASILLNSFMVIDATIPVIEDAEVEGALAWDLQPIAAFYGGIRYSPVDEVRIAATYRSALYHDLDATARVDVEVAGVLLEVDLLLESAAWYSPQQLALGGAVDVLPELTIAVDLTWYDWSAHPGPFVIASPAEGDPASIAAALQYAPRENHGFTDAWVPRFGAEYRLTDLGVALRGGYAYRAAVAPLPQQRSNVLDSSVHALAIGAGYAWGARDVEPAKSAFGSMAGGERAEPRGRDGDGINGAVDAYVRVSLMSEQHVTRTGDREQPVLNDYRFGGSVFELGASLTVGWL